MLTLLAHTVEPCGGAPGGPAGRPAHRADGRGRGVPDDAQPAPVQPGPHRPAVAAGRVGPTPDRHGLQQPRALRSSDPTRPHRARR